MFHDRAALTTIEIVEAFSDAVAERVVPLLRAITGRDALNVLG